MAASTGFACVDGPILSLLLAKVPAYQVHAEQKGHSQSMYPFSISIEHILGFLPAVYTSIAVSGFL